MRPQTISVPGSERRRPQRDPTASRRRRFLLIAIGLSIAVHIAAALLIIFLPRVLPQEARQQEEGTVELLMVEQKGGTPSEPGQPKESQPTPPQPQQKTEAPKTEAPKTETPKTETAKAEPQKPDTESAAAPSIPPPPIAPDATEPAPPPTVETPQKQAKAETNPDPQPSAQPPTPPPAPPPPPPPSPPKAQEAPVFDLAGTESESNAVVLGKQIVPASPDNRYRNRPPIFPQEAEALGQHGSVLVVIHVADTGVASGVDVVESSGVDSLDQAAVDAVRKWHFRPALKEGRAVPFDMPFRFIFEPF
jgi:protein TonB